MASPLSDLQDYFNVVNPAAPGGVPFDWDVSNSTDDESTTLAPAQTANAPWVQEGIGRDSVSGWWNEPDRYLPPTESAPGNGNSGMSRTSPYGPMTVGGGNNSVEFPDLVGGRIRFNSFHDDHAGDVGSDDFLAEVSALQAAGNVNVPTNIQVAQAILLGRINGTA
jgi:hypothetical protein